MAVTKLSTEELRELASRRDVQGIRKVFEHYNIVDIAEAVGELEIREEVFVLKVITRHEASEVFTYLDPDRQEKLVELLTSAELGSILSDVYADDIADFLDELPSSLAKKILATVPKERRDEVNELLSYKENSCGSIMGTNYVELRLGDTIAQAMEEVREQRAVAESISYGYVVSRGRLAGTIALRDLILSPNSNRLSEEMDKDAVYARTSDDQEVAIDLIKKYDLTMLPIIDEDEQLVGVITADDIVDAMEDEATEDIHKMAAVLPLQDGYLETNPLKIALSRLPWLLVLMIGDVFSENVINSNNRLIMLVPVLSVFIPMLMDSAGNAGSQSSTMVIRGIVIDRMNMKSTWMVLWKELRIALINGGVLFVVNMARTLIFMSYAGFSVALVSSTTLFIIIVIAQLIGGMLPLLADKCHLDPAVMASPLITCICDTVSLLIYFQLAGVML